MLIQSKMVWRPTHPDPWLPCPVHVKHCADYNGMGRKDICEEQKNKDGKCPLLCWTDLSHHGHLKASEKIFERIIKDTFLLP